MEPAKPKNAYFLLQKDLAPEEVKHFWIFQPEEERLDDYLFILPISYKARNIFLPSRETKMKQLITTYKKLEHSYATSNPDLQSQHISTQSVTPAFGTYYRFSTGTSYNSPIIVSDDDSSSSSDSDGAAAIIKRLAGVKERKKKSLYNSYENVVLPEMERFRQLKDEIMRQKMQKLSSQKSNDHAESSTPTQPNKHN